jgi:hypothetical protein
VDTQGNSLCREDRDLVPDRSRCAAGGEEGDACLDAPAALADLPSV